MKSWNEKPTGGRPDLLSPRHLQVRQTIGGWVDAPPTKHFLAYQRSPDSRPVAFLFLPPLFPTFLNDPITGDALESPREGEMIYGNFQRWASFLS